MRIIISLVDLSSEDSMKDPIRIVADLKPKEDCGPKRITVAMGDDNSGFTQTLPLNVLVSLLSQIMDLDEQRTLGSGLVGFDKPKIILPN